MSLDQSPRFDRVARIYRWLEYAAFGRALEQARCAHLDALAGCRDVLAIGDGDGRALAEVVRRNGTIRVRAIDASERMIALARRRLPADARGRVRFEHADARTANYPAAAYDAVLSFFSLDCFTTIDAETLIRRVAPSLRPGGAWLWTDFHIPPRGWRRWHARLWVGLLYRAFRVLTGLRASALPPVPDLLQAAGLREVARTDSRAGLLTSRVYVRSEPAVSDGPPRQPATTDATYPASR